ncbi:MAG: hypothetical protein Q9M91_06325 [Candidatus Dojkabacteria bacterium]|nr:hypothetical protein [Candidatus Dojkabacteria bacterium]MDQ7021412.1 hypothetical protein [Candidatus Dojkabacteria bacterium]
MSQNIDNSSQSGNIQETIKDLYVSRYEAGATEESPEESRTEMAANVITKIIAHFDQQDAEDMYIADLAAGPASVEREIFKVIQKGEIRYASEADFNKLYAAIGRVHFYTYDIAGDPKDPQFMDMAQILDINHTVGDLTTCELPAQQFDLVISNLGVDLIPERDLALRNALQSAKPDAEFIFHFHHRQIAKNIIEQGGMTNDCMDAMNYINESNHYFSDIESIRVYLQNLGFDVHFLFVGVETVEDPRVHNGPLDRWWIIKAKKSLR